MLHVIACVGKCACECTTAKCCVVCGWLCFQAVQGAVAMCHMFIYIGAVCQSSICRCCMSSVHVEQGRFVGPCSARWWDCWCVMFCTPRTARVHCTACHVGADSCGYVDVTWTCSVVLCGCCCSPVWGDVRRLAPPMQCAMACNVLCVLLASPQHTTFLVDPHVL
jgi:hypothetical protein